MEENVSEPARWTAPDGTMVIVGDTWQRIDKRKGTVVVVVTALDGVAGDIVFGEIIETGVVEVWSAPVFIQRFALLRRAGVTEPAPAAIERCSCPEAMHLREALKRIAYITERDGPFVADLQMIHDLAYQGLDLEPLVGDPNEPLGGDPAIGKVPE